MSDVGITVGGSLVTLIAATMAMAEPIAGPTQPETIGAPAKSIPTSPDTQPPSDARLKSFVVSRAADGLFYLTGRVEGVPVRFLIDTGANVVVLSPDDARRAGLTTAGSPEAARVQTANGVLPMSWTKLRSLEVGGRVLSDVTVAVAPGALDVSLLGMDLLSRLGPLTLDGGRILIHGEGRHAS